MADAQNPTYIERLKRRLEERFTLSEIVKNIGIGLVIGGALVASPDVPKEFYQIMDLNMTKEALVRQAGEIKNYDKSGLISKADSEVLQRISYTIDRKLDELKNGRVMKSYEEEKTKGLIMGGPIMGLGLGTLCLSIALIKRKK